MDWNENGTATRLEVVTIYRPTRVVAAVCCFICTLVMIISICPTAWVETETNPESHGLLYNREGLFRVCVRNRIDGQVDDRLGCYSQTAAFMKGVAALIIIGWLVTLAAGCLIVYGMRTSKDEVKIIFYKVAISLLTVNGIFLLIALIVFPVMVHRTLNAMEFQTSWSLSWAYMLNWAALVVDIFAIVLIVIDPNPDETSFREKVVGN